MSTRARHFLRAQRWLHTVTNRELQSWQATEPLANIITTVGNHPAAKEDALTRDATFSPGRGIFLPNTSKQRASAFNQRYSAQDAEQILQEVAQRWMQEQDPEARPYADPFYWAGFQLYGW